MTTNRQRYQIHWLLYNCIRWLSVYCTDRSWWHWRHCEHFHEKRMGCLMLLMDFGSGKCFKRLGTVFFFVFFFIRRCVLKAHSTQNSCEDVLKNHQGSTWHYWVRHSGCPDNISTLPHQQKKQKNTHNSSSFTTIQPQRGSHAVWIRARLCCRNKETTSFLCRETQSPGWSDLIFLSSTVKRRKSKIEHRVPWFFLMLGEPPSSGRWKLRQIHHGCAKICLSG